ncbi:MAG: hypothetical protein M0002_05125 [Rhodospirillales bacterium]|nr:hypothetical protein [Rhodospirillales bacterium]
MLDFLLLWLAERNRPAERQSEPLLAASLAALEKMAPDLQSGTLAIGHISLGTALCYLDFRFAAESWRDRCPALARWHAGFAARASVRATEPNDDTAMPLAPPPMQALVEPR